MKKIVFLIMCLCSVYANSQEGIPFFVNYPASVYQAHNRNFDVVCDSCGNVYFANFEGILHYDYNRWETIYTPGFSRVTRLFRDSEGRIWVGGYNVFGRIERDGRGCITLRTLLSDQLQMTEYSQFHGCSDYPYAFRKTRLLFHFHTKGHWQSLFDARP